ncbi:MAG: hypothetical protein JW932_07845 [Deltaproteobacteria bacterium]|nr:hypothetical protein [Deltaproteobacteria bacterium]
MFMMIVFIFMALVLFLATGAAIYMGIFKAHSENASLARKTFSGIASYGFSAVFWFFMYSYHYLGW